MQYPRVVIPHRGARVRVGSGFLHVPQRDPGVQRGGDERVSERVGCDGLSDPARRAARRTIRPAPCRPPAVRGQEYHPADGQVERPGSARRQRDGDDLAALGGDGQPRGQRRTGRRAARRAAGRRAGEERRRTDADAWRRSGPGGPRGADREESGSELDCSPASRRAVEGAEMPTVARERRRSARSAGQRRELTVTPGAAHGP
jgi:hypothetical protein